jgi:hypothetical protein
MGIFWKVVLLSEILVNQGVGICLFTSKTSGNRILVHEENVKCPFREISRWLNTNNKTPNVSRSFLWSRQIKNRSSHTVSSLFDLPRPHKSSTDIWWYKDLVFCSWFLVDGIKYSYPISNMIKISFHCQSNVLGYTWTE